MDGIYKPILSALVMPPVPFLLLILIGARLILPRRGWGYAILMVGVLGIWLSSCNGVAVWMQHALIKAPKPLPTETLSRLEAVGHLRAERVRRQPSKAGTWAEPAALMVLGGGRSPLAPEYGTSDLNDTTAQRLRYGVWLSRLTGLPLGISGGVGWAQVNDGGPSEAEVAARVAERQFGLKTVWQENRSADTVENARFTVAMLAEQGVQEVVVVTDAIHMPRAIRAFNEASRMTYAQHPDWPLMRVTPAPMGIWRLEARPIYDWVPSGQGFSRVRSALHEWVGWWVGM